MRQLWGDYPEASIATEVANPQSHPALALSIKKLPISKAGNPYLRRLLVQSAQYLLGHFGPDCALREYGLKLAARGMKADYLRKLSSLVMKFLVDAVLSIFLTGLSSALPVSFFTAAMVVTGRSFDNCSSVKTADKSRKQSFGGRKGLQSSSPYCLK